MVRWIFGCSEQQDQFQTPPSDMNRVSNILPVWTNIAISTYDLGGIKPIV